MHWMVRDSWQRLWLWRLLLHDLAEMGTSMPMYMYAVSSVCIIDNVY